MLATLTEVDQVNHIAWGIHLPHMPGKPGIAVGRYVRLKDEPTVAECYKTAAFAQAESIWQASRAQDPECAFRLTELYIAWSRLNAYQQNFEEAADLAKKAEALAGASHRHQAEVFNILGLLARMQGDQAGAIEAFSASLSLTEDRDELIIAASNNLALVYIDTAAWTEAEALLQTAIKRCQKIGDRHREAALYNNLADIYHHQGQKDLSMHFLKKALSYLSQIGMEDEKWQPEIWKLTTW